MKSTITGSFMPDVVATFIGKARMTAVLKRRPCDFIVEELSRWDLQCTFSGESDLAPNMYDFGKGLVGIIVLSDRLTTAAVTEKVRRLFNLPRHVKISTAGLKDRWAWTVQLMVLPWKDMDKLRKILASQGSFEQAMARHNFYVKDPHSVRAHLHRGHLEGNRFTIRVDANGAPKALLREYMEAAMARARDMRSSASLAAVAAAMNLGPNDVLVPNAYGNQRQGARQNLASIGETYIKEGPEPAFKRFLLETTSNEGNRARDLRRELAKEWTGAEEAIAKQQREAEASGDPAKIESASKLSVVKMRMYLQGMLEILEKADRFAYGKPAYEVCNMVYEWRLVRAMFMHLDYEAVMRDQEVKDDISLWVGAYQGYHFNALLAKTITGELQLETLVKELGILVDALVEDQKLKDSFHRRNLRLMEVPLFSCEKVAMSFYQRFMPEAIPEQIHPLVKELYLSPGGNGKGPWRPPYVVPKGLEWDCEDDAVKFRFTLRSGAYATTFLGLMFNLIEAKKEKKKTGNRNRR